MKIAILSFYSGHLYRGVERWTDDFASILQKRGHEVVVFQNGPRLKGTSYKTVSTNLKVDWQRRALFFAKVLYLDYWSRLVFISTLKVLLKIRQGDFDIIIPTNNGWQARVLRLLTFFIKAKLVIVGHAGKGWDERNNLYTFPDVFVALSNRAQRWAKSFNPFLKVVKIPNGVNIYQFKPQGKKYKPGFKKPLILSVGALTKSKRMDLVVKAVAQVENADLLIVGEGVEKAKLVRLGQKLMPGRIKIIRAKFEEMPTIYRAADVVTSASAPFYSFELVLLEALACNKAVVANKDPIRQEIIGKAGILVDPTNSQAYTKTLKKALGVNWGTKPRRQAEKFSWDRIVKEYEKIFQT